MTTAPFDPTSPSSSSVSDATSPELPRTLHPMLDLLYPLSEFFHHGESVPLAELEAGGARMPEPFRSLLVHDSDMTSTLEAYHGERLELSLLDKMHHGTDLFRQVVLVGVRSGRARELGAIRIDLTRFEAEARRLILEARQPLGSILGQLAIDYTSQPRLYFHVSSTARMREIFALDGIRLLYGRQNVLMGPDGMPLAEVVEILPPLDAVAI